MPTPHSAHIMKRILLVAVGFLLCGIVVATIWTWRSSPALRYRALGDPASFDKAFATLKKGDTIHHVCSVLGEKHFDAESESSIRETFKALVESYPEHLPSGYRETDTVFAYATDDRGWHGIQFRNGRIIAFCYP